EDRQLLEHQPDLSVVLSELDHVWKRAAAITAVIVEELDDAHIAAGIAGNVGHRRAEDRLGIVGDRFLLLLGLLSCLALVELGGHLDEDLGVLGQVVAQDAFDAGLVGRDWARSAGELAWGGVAEDEIARAGRRHGSDRGGHGHIKEDFSQVHVFESPGEMAQSVVGTWKAIISSARSQFGVPSTNPALARLACSLASFSRPS